MRATRRAVLLAAATAGAAVGATACTGPAEDVAPRPVDPDVALRSAAVAREQALVAAYDAALAADPGQTALLAPLRAEHSAHLAALGAGATAPGTGPSPGASADPGSSADPGAGGAAAGGTPAVAGGPPPTRADLAGAERAAATAHAEATVPASAGLAALLAQLAASEASHPVALA